MNTQDFSKVFPLGSHLCRQPMPPMPELKRDMELLKLQGFNLVKLQENWSYDEPSEGQIDLEIYEELIEHAARLDLGVYLGLTCEQAPAWLWRKHPDCRMQRRDGLPVAYEAQMTLPADGKPGPCYDHPGAMADQLRFIQTLVKRLGRFENVVVWNTWQEVAYWSERLAGGHVCYCAHTLEHFRRWLQDKYDDLDGLNRAWKTGYADWIDVQPDRTHTGRECLPQDVDWFFYMDNIQISAVLRARYEAIRAADPAPGGIKRPIFAHLGSPVIGSGRHWHYARCQDFLGSSCYPAWSPLHPWDDGARHPLQKQTALLAEMCSVALTYDQVRSCNRPGAPVWAAEFQGGPVSTGFHKGRVPSAGDIRRWMLTAIASGVSAISFWVTRAEIAAAEVNGFSLLDSVGETTPRFEEAARIGRAINRHADLFKSASLPQAEAAILINEANHQFCASMVQGGEHLEYSTRGWHRILWRMGIPVDFLDTSELDLPYSREYQVLILPFPLSLSEVVLEKLSDYVKRGGNLVCEAAPGRLDANAYANRGELSPAARELFGIEQAGFKMVREPGGQNRWSPPERTWGEYLEAVFLEGTGKMAGQRARANVYVETLLPVDSQPILLFGEETAGIHRQVEQGNAWLVGTYLGHNGTAYLDEDNVSFVRSLMAQCGITPNHPGRLLLRRRLLNERLLNERLLNERLLVDREAWIFTNPTANSLSETIDINGWSEVEVLLPNPLVEPLKREGDQVTISVESLDVCILILSRDIQK